MEKYLGIKIVDGEPQICPKDDQKNKKGDDGYKVVYKDGYTSWSPKKTFEDSYFKVKINDKEFLSQFFAYEHLPKPLQKISIPFCALANNILKTTPRNPERTVALRKLLEAKDCAVRAFIAK